MNFKELVKKKIDLINQHLDEYIKESQNYQKNIYRAMRYSLFAGGKRLRPIITLASCNIVGGDMMQSLPVACAIEMIHTYSLIHDDLPAMDNDDYRRGKLTNHKVFGKAIAVLAGDALLTKAFDIAINESVKIGVEPTCLIRALSIIAEKSGTEGMIGGQVVDLESENLKIDYERLEYIDLLKTSALITAAAKAGAYIGGGSEGQVEALEIFSQNLGLAFQIQDDILDVEGNQEILGKPIGSDVQNNKSTFVSLLGLEESKEKVRELTNEAIKSLEIFGEKKWFLKELAEHLIHREY